MGAQLPGPVQLKCSVKKYDWGKRGKDSTVARLYRRNGGEETADDEPYAELWMGSHESGPCYVVFIDGANDDHKLNLKDWIGQNPCVLGEKVIQHWGLNLPFLFKVLSVEKALSLQAHPDKVLASVLHKKHPDVYKDDNHKPEMALAITGFEALCGFVSLEELKGVVVTVPEITKAVGDVSLAETVLNLSKQDEEKTLKEALQSLFTQLMSADKDTISELIPSLISRLNSDSKVRELTDKEELAVKLAHQYPGDIGVLAAFLFNYVKLKPGEALFLDANEPHAYVHGECIECMATSDNVVRAGLTPKFRDVETLCSMLTYKQGFPEILKGVPSGPYTMKYSPPFDEFEVDWCHLPPSVSGSVVAFPAVPGPTVWIITAGEGAISTTSFSELGIAAGDSFFVPASIAITVQTNSGLDLFRAGVSSRFLEKSGI